MSNYFDHNKYFSAGTTDEGFNQSKERESKILDFVEDFKESINDSSSKYTTKKAKARIIGYVAEQDNEEI